MINSILAAVNSANNLAQIQAGFSNIPEVSPEDFRYIVFLAALVVILLIVLTIYNFKRKKNKQNKGWSSITNGQAIWEIITRAVARQAHFILEIYDARHTITYKGTLEAMEDDSYLILSLSETPSSDADFSNLPGVMHINFRPGPKESMDHYQFATKVIKNRFINRQGWTVAELVLPLPKIITSAQRRSFLRLEPVDQFAFDCRLNDVPEGSIPDLDSLEAICRGQIMDISIGGAQIKMEKPITLRETQRFVGVMTLPLEGLGLEMEDPTLVILMQLLSQEHVASSPQFGQEAHVLLRVRFLGRYIMDKLQNRWTYRGLTQSSFQELAYWMQAFQRFYIKRKLNYHPPDEAKHRPPNMFPSSPPQRPPKKDA